MASVFVGWDENEGRMRFSRFAFEGATELPCELPEQAPCAVLGRFADAGEEPGEVREWLFSDEAAGGAETALRVTDRDDWFVAVLRE